MRGRTTYPKKETREDVFARLKARSREDADEVAACSRADAVVPMFLAATDPMRVLSARLADEGYAGGATGERRSTRRSQPPPAPPSTPRVRQLRLWRESKFGVVHERAYRSMRCGAPMSWGTGLTGDEELVTCSECRRMLGVEVAS